MSVVAFIRLIKEKYSAVKVFTVSLADINQVLVVLKREKLKLTLSIKL